MWAGIIAIFPTVAAWINSIVGFFQGKAALQSAANSAETTAESGHEDDGAQSVADMNSANAQNAALDQAAAQMNAQEKGPVK